MRKGSLVRVIDKDAKAFRLLTAEEIQDWREFFERRQSAGHHSGFDSAGEPILPPRSVMFVTEEEKYYAVLRSRARAVRNYQLLGGLCELLDFETGKSFFVPRSGVALAEEM